VPPRRICVHQLHLCHRQQRDVPSYKHQWREIPAATGPYTQLTALEHTASTYWLYIAYSARTYSFNILAVHSIQHYSYLLETYCLVQIHSTLCYIVTYVYVQLHVVYSATATKLRDLLNIWGVWRHEDTTLNELVEQNAFVKYTCSSSSSAPYPSIIHHRHQSSIIAINRQSSSSIVNHEDDSQSWTVQPHQPQPVLAPRVIFVISTATPKQTNVWTQECEVAERPPLPPLTLSRSPSPSLYLSLIHPRTV